MNRFIWPATTAGILLSAVVGLAACGGGTSATSASSTPAAASPSSSSTAAAGSAPAGRENPYANPTVQACLQAAGIAIPTFAGRPSGARPSGSFTRPSGSFTRPTGVPTGSFTRGAGGGFGGGVNSAELQKIQQALAACGISLPTPSFTRGAGGGGFGGPASTTPAG
jgi:hypothetical protein